MFLFFLIITRFFFASGLPTNLPVTEAVKDEGQDQSGHEPVIGPRPGPAVAQEEGAEAHLLHGVAVAVGLALLVEHLVLRRAPAAGDLALCKT